MNVLLHYSSSIFIFSCSFKLCSPFAEISTIICAVNPNIFIQHFCPTSSAALSVEELFTTHLHFVDPTLLFPFALQTIPSMNGPSFISRTLMKLLLPKSQRPQCQILRNLHSYQRESVRAQAQGAAGEREERGRKSRGGGGIGERV